MRSKPLTVHASSANSDISVTKVALPNFKASSSVDTALSKRKPADFRLALSSVLAVMYAFLASLSSRLKISNRTPPSSTACRLWVIRARKSDKSSTNTLCLRARARRANNRSSAFSSSFGSKSRLCATRSN